MASIGTKLHFLIGMYAYAARIAIGQTWVVAPAFPDATQGRTGCTGLVFQGSLFAIGGRPFSVDGDTNAAVHSLGVSDTQWAQAAWLEGPIVGQGAGVDALDRIIVFGGRDGIDPEGDLGQERVYNPVEGLQDSIAPRGASAPPLNFATARDSERRIYSLGGGPGETATAGDPNTTYCERYDALSDTWQPIAPLPFAVAGAASVYDGQGHLVVIGGYDGTASTRLASVLQYDIASDTWSDTTLPELPVALSDARAVLGADDRIYVIGGLSGPVGAGNVESSVHVLDLTTQQWVSGPAMITARYAFAAALSDDHYIYAMGGSDAGSGTWLVDKLYTPPCPVFVGQPQPMTAWQFQLVKLTATVEGGTPLSYRWRKDGADLVDGPADGGGTISGATSSTLTISGTNLADEGAYTLAATNPCGTAISDPAMLTVRVPPTIPTRIRVVNLHPAWALSSRANGVYGNQQVGSASKMVEPYGSLDRPILWTGSATSAVDLTPPGSVGGGCNAVSDTMQVGWWWWPYQCYVSGQWQTCHTRQACAWFGMAASYDNLQYSGWEYSVANDVDGNQPAGTISTDDEVGNTFAHGGIWTGPSLSFMSLHPTGVSKSFVNAIADGRQYGFIHTPFPAPKVHAAMWDDSAASFQEVHPGGASRSYINGAGDGQQVGMAELSSSHAGLWYDSQASFSDLHPSQAASSEANDAAGGLQVGWVNADGHSEAVIWRGTADSAASLHPALPPEFGSSSAVGIHLTSDGVISVVGYGYNSNSGRTEALLWLLDPYIPPDIDRDHDVDQNDVDIFVNCGSGPAVPVATGCDNADLDGDGDGDQADFGILQKCLSGSGNEPDPTCHAWD